MGRPRSFREEAVLEAATAVFVRGGYEVTSIDDLVQALKLHRGSLYKAFGSKHGLFLAVLRHYVKTQLPDAINSAPTSGDSHTDVAALADGDVLDLLLVAALERGHLDVEVASLVRHALTCIENFIDTATNSGCAPQPANPPTRALGLLGVRLHQRLRAGPDEPSAPPRIPARSTTKEN